MRSIHLCRSEAHGNYECARTITNAADQHLARQSISSAPHYSRRVGENWRRTKPKNAGNFRTRDFYHIKRESFEEDFTSLRPASRSAESAIPNPLRFLEQTSLRRDKKVERSLPPPSVLGSCAFLHSRLFKTCEFRASRSRSLVPRMRRNYDHPRDRKNVRPSFDNASRIWAGPSITHWFRLPIPGAALRPTFRGIRRSLKRVSCLYYMHRCRYKALDLSLLR